MCDEDNLELCCGTRPIMHTCQNPNLDTTYIYCPVCGAMTLDDTRQLAMDSWNKGVRVNGNQ